MKSCGASRKGVNAMRPWACPRAVAIGILLCVLKFGLGAGRAYPTEPFSEMDIRWLERQERAREWGRDPFALPGGPAGSAVEMNGDFHLSAIIYHSGRGLAIINNRILRPGDQIEGLRVSEILEDRVILEGTAGPRELRVRKFVLGR